MREYPDYCRYPQRTVKFRGVLDCWSLLNAEDEINLEKSCKACEFNVENEKKEKPR